MNEANVPVVVVTNQSGVARGLFEEQRVADVHHALSELLAFEGAHVDRYFYCPHHPTAGQGRYRRECDCRKPRPGMLLRAAHEMNLDLRSSWLVGDKLSDLQAGAAAGCCAILVRTGYGKTIAQQLLRTRVPPPVADDLAAAVEICLRSNKTQCSSAA